MDEPPGEPGCGGDIRLIAFITDPGAIRKILTHLGAPLKRNIQRLDPALTSNNAGLKQAIGSISRDSIDIFTAVQPAFEFWQPLLDFPCV